MDIKHFFSAQLVDHTSEGTLTDGSVLWEIVTEDGERVASCTKEEPAKRLEMVLNIALTEWAEEDEEDHDVNV